MTKKLGREAFGRARQFLLTGGARKLEAALFRYEFERGSIEDVYLELEKFQNDDGGFGRALEPDLRCAASSALATTTALQLLLSENIRNEAMIGRAMQYLVNSYNDNRTGWDIIPKEAELSSRAIWWNYGAFEDHWGNPNAEIVGYFNVVPVAGHSDLTAELNDYASQYLQEKSDLKEMHEMLCYVRWANTLSKEAYEAIGNKLDEFIDNCVARMPEDRIGYGCPPLMLVDSPKSRYYAKYEAVIPGDLDQMIESQGADGTWLPNWTWGRFEDEWETAKTEWQGIITLNSLRTLRRFGRLDTE
ncbi:hypothetical protein [Cohnella herbarum]|uniref:Uncharacterized protein n=1 Tax=Cohnella herbarum TaxID=2728023 RepID=A0A7Z2VQB0_9BACL|nr:hypothetical protein [Cohnella herbarum]QJD87226.1 hypothetical protein HH215_31310 [Cohnella herbarum]